MSSFLKNFNLMHSKSNWEATFKTISPANDVKCLLETQAAVRVLKANPS